MASAIDDFLNYGKPKPPKAGEPSAIDSFLAYKPVVAAPVVEAAPAPVEPEGPGLIKSLGDRALGTGAAGLDIIANTAATANTQTPWDAVPGGSTAFNALETTAGVIGAGKEYLPEFLTDRAQALQQELASQRVASPETQGPRSEFLQDFESQAREYSAAARGEQTAEEQAAQQGLGKATEYGVGETLSYLWNNPRALGTVVDSLIPSIATGGAAGKVAAGAGKTAAMAAQLGVGSSIEGMAAGQGAYDSVMKADEMDLAASDLFWKLKEQTGSNEAARQAMADIARTVGSSTATASSLLLAGIGQKYGMNVVEDRLLGRAMKGATGSRTANAVIGFGKEGLTEGTQGATAQLSQNIGAMAGGAEWDLTKGVGSAYALEAIAGAGPGAIGGLTSSTKRPAPVLPPTGDPAVDAGIKAAADMAAAATPEATTPTPIPTPEVVAPKPRGAFGSQPAPALVPVRTGVEAAAIVDNRIAALQEASQIGRLPPEEVKALDRERTELETILREQDQALKDNVVLAPANRLTRDERQFIGNRRLEISSKIEKHRTAVAQENELKKLQERLGKVTDDNQFIKLSESLVPVENRVAPVAPAQTPVGAPSVAQSAPITASPANTPFIDDSQTLADEADLTSIDQQVAAERTKTLNSEARNRVIKEISSTKDRRTAANLQKMIGDGRIQFYGDQATLPEGANSATDKGYFDGQRIYLNEAKLGEGEANSVALHEIKHYMDRLAEDGGTPVRRRSLRQFLGNEGNARVNTRIDELASTGNKIAREAIDDARYGATKEDGTFDRDVFQDEVVPYFLQKVAAARESNRPLGRALGVVKDIVSAAKIKIADFGIDLGLSENDILYLGKQLVGEAAKVGIRNSETANTQAGQRSAQTRQKALSEKPVGRASKERPKNNQVDTPQFKAWFKDSKVVDADGEPLVVYHGTTAEDIGSFIPRIRKGEQLGFGIHFAEDGQFASNYADPSKQGRGKAGGQVLPVFLSIQKPLLANAVVSEGSVEFNLAKKLLGKNLFSVRNEDGVPSVYLQNVLDAVSPLKALTAIKDAGFDGVRYESVVRGRGLNAGNVSGRSPSWIAFSPEQIKSATGNSGAFSPTNPDIRASKARPEQPQRVTARLGSAGISQPLSRRAPMPTQARGVVPASNKYVGEKTRTPATEGIVSKIKAVGDVALAAVAPSSYGKAADVSEVLERATGETTESKVRAAQAINALESTVKQVPKAKRDGVRRALVDASSENAKVRAAGIETLKTAYPAVYAQYDSVRNQIRQWGLDAVVSIRDSGKQLTKKDVAVVSKMLKNLDTYVTRAYRKDFKGPIADQQVRDTQGAWEKETKKGALVSEGAKTFEEARQFLVDTLRIGQREGMLKANGNLKDFKPQTLEQLEALHAEWVSRENFNTLPVDATPEQQETYINTMLLDLENVRKSMSDADYLKKLDDKALRLTKELLDTVNTGSSKLVQFFRGARQDNTIVSAREDVPVAIRKLWGEITEPTAALAITLMRQGEFLARQKMLRELYDIGLGRYFVDQKDATSDTFTEKLVGETFGPLEGMYATPRFKQQVESNIEPLNSWRKVMEAMTSGKADVATQAAAGMSIKFISSLGSKNKKATVVWNPVSWLNNFLGGPATPVMQGMLPGKNIRKAASAAIGLVGPSYKKEMTEYTERIIKANLQESGQVGEIQQAQKDIIQSLLLDQSVLGRLNAVRKRVDDRLVDAYAMTDVMWKLDAFFSTVDWLKGYYKAKGITRTDEQIDREAAVRVKDRSITFSRAAPLVKFTEKLGLTSYAPYFYETYRTIGMSLIGAVQDINNGRLEGGEAGRMKVNLGIRSALGATSALAYNRAILPLYEAVGGAALLGMVALGAMPEFEEEEKEKLAVIRKGMGDFYNGKELTFWRKTDDGKFIFIEPGRVNPNDPATTPAALLMSGDPEAALEAIGGLFFGNQGIAAVLGVGGEILFDKKAKKPSSAYSTAQQYSEMENTLQNSLGIDPDTTAQVTRVIEKYAPKVLKTSLREATEDTGLEGVDKFLAAMGQPFAVFDPKKDLKLTGFRDYSAPIDKAKEDFKTAIQTTSPSDEVIQEAYLRSLRMEHEAFTRMREVVEAAKMTGLRPDQVAGVLKESNIGNGAQIASLLSGKFKPSFVSETSVQNSRKQELKEDGAKVPEIDSKYRRIDRIIRDSNKAFLEEIN